MKLDTRMCGATRAAQILWGSYLISVGVLACERGELTNAMLLSRLA